MPLSRSRAHDDIDKIRRARDAMFAAFNAGDVDTFVAPLAEDVVLMPHTGPPAVVGKIAVRSDYEEFFAHGPFVPRLTWSSEEVVVCGGWAFDRGTWEIIRTYKRSARRERLDSCYSMVWRRERARPWKLARFIWNGAATPIIAETAGKGRGKSKERSGRKR